LNWLPGQLRLSVPWVLASKETNFEFTPNRDGMTEEPNMFKREFSVAVAGLVYKDGSAVDFGRGIKSAMRKIDAELGRE
jgi:hypothetical protein